MIKTKQLFFTLCCIMLAKFSMAQDPTFTLVITNDVQISPSELQFDIYLLHTGGRPTFELSGHQYGISFNSNIAGSGTISASLLAGSSALSNPAQINFSPYTVSNNQIRMLAPPAPGVGNGSIISKTSPGTKIARVRLTNTVPFPANTHADLAWNFLSTPAGQSTKTQVAAYAGATGTTNTMLTTDSTNTLIQTTNPGLNGVCVSQPTVNAGGPYSSCGNVSLHGSTGGSATGGTWSTTTAGTFVPNNNTLNATYQPSNDDISTGNVTLTLISNNPSGFPCEPDTSRVTVTFFSCDDNDACTQDFCNAQGVCQHTPLSPSLPGAMTGSTGVCVPVNGQAYNIPAQAGVTFTWTVPANVTIASGQGTNAIFTNWASNATTGSVCVTATNTCGTGAQRCKTVTKRTVVPGTVGVITGSAIGCPGDVRLYTVRKLSSADLYTWTPPAGTRINGSSSPFTTVDTMVNVTFTASFTGDTLRVVGVNCKGTSATQRKLRISKSAPATPGTIAGQTTALCNATGIVYSIAPVVNANTYTWATAIAGVTINGNPSPYTTANTSVTLNFGASGTGTLTVKANNGCGSSANKSLTLTSKIPSTPSAITGDAFGVCNKTAVPYSVTNVAGVTYNWSFTVAGATIGSGQGTSAVTANYSASYVTGSIRVSATNGCGTSAFRTKVVKATPPTSAAITGDPTVCVNQQGVPYSTAALLGASTYTWTGPTGSHIVANGTTSPSNTITTTANAVAVNYATTAGTVKVRGNNACGNGSTKSLAISFVCRGEELVTENSFDAAVYPNPTSGSFTIQLFNRSSEKVIIELMDLTGRIIEGVKSSDDLVEFNQSDLSKGIYLLRIQQDDTVLVKQLTIVK